MGNFFVSNASYNMNNFYNIKDIRENKDKNEILDPKRRTDLAGGLQAGG